MAPTAEFNIQLTYSVINPEEQPEIIPIASEFLELVPTWQEIAFSIAFGLFPKVCFITQIVFYFVSLRLLPSDSLS